MVPVRKLLIPLFMSFVLLTLAACAPGMQPGVSPSPAASATSAAASVPTATTAPAAPAVITATPDANTAPTLTAPSQPGSLSGTSWTLVSYGAPDAQTPVVSGSTTNITFGADGQAEGSGGCNSYGGQYTVSGDTVKFQQVISTMMACADTNINRQEQQFFKALNSAGKFQVANGRLTIAYDNGQGLLTFTQGASSGSGAEASPTTAAQPSPTTGGGTAGGTTGGTTGTENIPYLDDRSTPTGLIQSYFNAINRREYLRAYAYYRDPANAAGSFDQFQAGYQNTASVAVTFGQIGGDAGAGQMYYSVPALLKATTTNGTTQTYAACYILHLSNPGVQAAPPFIPLGIERGTAKAVASGANATDALASACSGPDFPTGQPINPAPVTNTADISKNNYLDDRSGAVEVLSSLFNAVNRKEYARAYSYWENAGSSAQVPAFDQFQKGYADTESIALQTGKVTGGAGAGQRYYSVPVVLKVQTTAGAQQTFAGCYTLHLANPQIQAALPFHPLAIQSAVIKQVDNNADAAALLNQPCGP